MAKQTPEQRRESLRQGGRTAMAKVAARGRYPKGHPRAGSLLARGVTLEQAQAEAAEWQARRSAQDPPEPPADPPPPPPADPPKREPARPAAGGLNPLTMTPRDVFDRIRGGGR